MKNLQIIGKLIHTSSLRRVFYQLNASLLGAVRKLALCAQCRGAGGWLMAVGCWRLVGSWLLATGGVVSGWRLIAGGWRLVAGSWRRCLWCRGAYRSLYLAKNVCAILCRFYERVCRIGLILENVCENLEGVVCWSGKSLLWTYKNI